MQTPVLSAINGAALLNGNTSATLKPTVDSVKDAMLGLRGFEQVFVPHGTTLLAQGDRTDCVFYILKGLVVEEELNIDGEAAWADIKMRGEVAGLNCVTFGGGWRGHYEISTASIQALTDVFAVRLPRYQIANNIPDDSALSKMVHDILQLQTVHLHNHLLALCAKSAQARVVMLLQSLFQRAIERQVIKPTQRLPISQVTIAKVANVSVVHMNRIVQKLRLDGVLDWTTDGVSMTA
jgi:CRP-like cAMP-binding protein